VLSDANLRLCANHRLSRNVVLNTNTTNNYKQVSTTQRNMELVFVRGDGVIIVSPPIRTG
jgi:hypothetical protein